MTHASVMEALRTRGRMLREMKVTFNHKVSLRPVWVKWDLAQKAKKNKVQHQPRKLKRSKHRHQSTKAAFQWPGGPQIQS